MAHGYPLSPTILNFVVDSVVCHCKSLVAERAWIDISNDDVAQPEGRMIRSSNDRQRRMEEIHTRLR